MSSVPSSVKSSFELDVAAYVDALPQLVDRHEGKFVLISSGKVIDAHESYAQARRVGHERFGDEPFLVKQVSRQDCEAAPYAQPCQA